MGGCHLGPRIQTAIPTPASSFKSGRNDHHQRPGTSFGTRSGVIRPPDKGCHRGSGSSAATQGILFSVLPRSKKVWRISPDLRSTGIESFYEGAPFSHVDCSGRATVCPQRGMVHVHRPQGRLFSCPDLAAAPAVSQVRISRSPLAVQGTPLRSLALPKSVHTVCDGSSGTPAGPGCEGAAISGRLVDLRSLSYAGDATHDSSSFACGSARIQGQSGEELSDAFTGNDIHWCDPEHLQHVGSTLPPSGPRYSCSARSVQVGSAAALRHVSEASWEADFYIACRPPRSSHSTSIPEVVECVSLRPQARPAQETSRVMAVSSHPCSMEKRGLHLTRCAHGTCRVVQGGGYDGCQPNRLGGSVAAQSDSGPMVCAGTQPSHQCAGASCCALGPQVFLAMAEGEACAGTVRQHHSGVSYQSPRGNQVGGTSESFSGPSDLGGPSSFQSAGDVPSRGEESVGRFPLTSRVSPRGVASAPRGGAGHLGPLRRSRGGPFCQSRYHTLSSMVLPVRGRPIGPGCPRSSLAANSSLCLSTVSFDPANPSEDSSRGPPGVVGGSILASADMVSAATQTLSQTTMAPSGQDGPPLSARGTCLASQPPTAPVMGLAIGEPELPLTDISGSVRQTILNARALSTRQQYDNRWRLFSRWCIDHCENPVSCSVSVVLEFLQSLLDTGRSPSTLKVYVAAISCRHSRVDNVTVGSHHLVSLFLRGARRLHPPTVPRAPTWDLPLVLSALCQPPYEPLAQADLRWVSLKTAFLLAITSAKRVSELHALSVSASCLRWNPDGSGVTLLPNTAFLPKVLSRFHCNQPINLVQFVPPPGEGGQGSELLCPVRSLRAYVAATAGIRKSDQLFLCYGGARLGCALSKQRFSHWVVDVILHAYRTAGRPLPSSIRCHSTRSVSTSWAALRGVPLEAICAAASWASPSTFTRFYRVNVATSQPLDTVLQLGSSESAL